MEDSRGFCCLYAVLERSTAVLQRAALFVSDKQQCMQSAAKTRSQTGCCPCVAHKPRLGLSPGFRTRFNILTLVSRRSGERRPETTWRSVEGLYRRKSLLKHFSHLQGEGCNVRRSLERLSVCPAIGLLLKSTVNGYHVAVQS
jgi:hypothetical protein